jgi:hypothetical protein
MEDKLLDQGFRKSLIQEIRDNENEERMQESLRDCDVYKGNIRPYVVDYLQSRFSTNTVNEMSIVSSVNIVKKIVDQKASLYKNPPERIVQEASDTQDEAIEAIYTDMMADAKFLSSNRHFELQKQNHVMIVPKEGRLHMRSIKCHQVNVVPSAENPERGEIYILSSFDKQYSRIKDQSTDNINQTIADEDDYKEASRRFIVWSKSYHFVMDGHANILSVDEQGEARIENPIAPVIPIIEVSGDKDFEYFIRGGSEVSQFTVEYNGALSSLGHIVDMQGFAQAYLKAPESLQPTSIQIGPNYILRLMTDPNIPNSDVEFGFAQSGADLSGAQSYVESLLAQFLSSQGLNPNTVVGRADGSTGFSSGIERLLALVEKFESSKDVMALYQKVERQVFSCIKAWHNLARISEDVLEEKYLAEEMSEDLQMQVVFSKPEAVQTEAEMLDIIDRKIEMGVASRIDALMELEKLTREQAIERAAEIDEDEMPSNENNIPMDFGVNSGEQTEGDETN